MSTTVQDILEGAYNRNSSNDPGKLAVDGELVAHLHRVFQRVFALMARARPDQFSTTAFLTLAGATPQATLPASIIDILNVLTVLGAKVNVIPITEQFRTWHLAPAVYRRGQALVSRNKSGDPAAGNVLTLIHLDAPATLAALADVLDARYPARHYQLLIDLCANYLGTKDAGRSPADRAALGQELAVSLNALQMEYQLAPADVSWMHSSVERSRDGQNANLGGS